MPALRIAARPTAADTGKSALEAPAMAPPGAQPAMAMRRYQVMSLLDGGQVERSEHIGPATPVFEAAFSAFAHGTLIGTPRGRVAVEDLEPGMRVSTATQGAQEVVWLGAMSLVPRAKGGAREGALTRLTADSFGPGRPERDLLAGPGARLLQRGTSERATLVPATALVDGVNAVSVLPPRAVTLYHICLRQHAVITADGLESESYHPGTELEAQMGARLLGLFLSFFPHLRSAQEFGPLAHPRLPLKTGEASMA